MHNLVPVKEVQESTLLGLPLEVRHHIYRTLWGTSTHLFLLDGDLQIMECQGADDSSHRYPADEPEYENPRWIRRVDSTWGCHWRCEERYLDGQNQDKAVHTPLLPLLLSSKAFASDVLGFLSQPTQHVHFTDLETIDLTLSATMQQTRSKLPEAQPSREAKQCHLFKSLCNVDLTLRLPLSVINTLFVHFFEKFKQTQMLPRPGGTPERSGRQREHEQWMRMWHNLLETQHLRQLTLWLDHDKALGWDQVAEAQILQGLSDIMPSLKNRKIEVTVNLPRLIPKKWSPTIAEDFLVDSEAGFRIQRRYRLPWARQWSGPPGLFETEELKDEVVWANNGENPPAPADVRKSFWPEPFDEFGVDVFDELGFDVFSEEFARHPVFGTGMSCQMGYI